MLKPYAIYVDRLKDDNTMVLDGENSPAFLEVQEADLSFPDPVLVRGRAYLADDHLILQLHIQTRCAIPCSICNEIIALPIEVPSFYHTEPLSDLAHNLFDYTELLREAILLQIPAFSECHGGQCPERPAIAPFLKKKATPSPVSQKDPVHFPFADL